MQPLSRLPQVWLSLAVAIATSSPSGAQEISRRAEIESPRSYAEKVRASIQPVVFSGSVNGNPVAVIEITTNDEGVIVGRRLMKSSGDPAWDEAAYRAVYKTDVIPLDIDGKVPHKLEIVFSPRPR
jgi:colicin import membrane protein